MQKINHFLIKYFNLKQEESLIFSLLFFHSFFLGLFIAFYFVPANAVFIQHFRGDQLPLAYIASGIVGYLSTYIYARLQKRVASKALFLGALLFMLFITLVARMGMFFVGEEWLSAFVFIWAWPFISLVGIEAGGLSLRFLNLIQVKRLFGLFNMGGVMASILGYLTVPVISHFIGHSYNLLIIGIFGLLISIFILLYIYKKFPDKSEQEKLKSKSESNITFFNLFKERYFLLIFLSATFSMIVIYITDFGFLSTVKIQINPASVSKYLALVYGGLKIGELIISYFSSRLLSKYGVKLGLTILPLVTILLVSFASITGLFLGAASILFLIFMTLNKSSERILRRGLDDPAFNILYQPLPNENKLAVQTKVGVVQQLAIAIAGVLLLLSNLILATKEGFLLQYFPLFFLPILGIWVFISRKLYLAYRGKLKQILVDITRSDKKSEGAKYLYGSEVLTKKLKKFNDNVVNMSVTVLSETNPRLLEPYVASLLESSDVMVQKGILRNIDPTWRPRIADAIEKLHERSTEPEIKKLATYAKSNLNFTNISTLKAADISKLRNSDKIEDKLTLIKYLYKNNLPGDESIILQLLEDKNKLVKSAAITLTGKRRSPVLISKLIELLTSSEFHFIAGSVLIDIGDKILNELDQFFENQSSPEVLLRIIEIYAKIGSTPARSILVSHLDYPNREVQFAVIWALYFCRFQADSKDLSVIRRKLEEEIENILWIIAAINDIEEEKNTLKLYQALDQEKENHFELLFQLLSFMYEPRIINLIRKNIIGKNTIFALEIIDNFIAQDIKQLIVPLFEDISDSSRLKKLHHIFPQEKMHFADRLKAIIIREYNKMDTWSITKAIELLGKLQKSNRQAKGSKASRLDYHDINIWNNEKLTETLERIRRSEMPDEVFVCLFHTDELVYSTAAKIIYEENPIKCFDYLTNMSSEKQNLMAVLSNEGQILSERVRLLKRHPMYFNVPEKLLVKLAKLAQVKEFKKNEEIFLEYEKEIDDIFIIMKGLLVYNYQKDDATYFFKNEIIIKGLTIDGDAKSLIAKKASLVYIVNRFDYFNLLVSETEIIQHIFNEIQTESEAEGEK